MATDNDDRDSVFVVLENTEKQYSIWPDVLRIPDGWSDVGQRGSRADCLAYIDRVWTDMRPLRLRQRMSVTGQ